MRRLRFVYITTAAVLVGTVLAIASGTIVLVPANVPTTDTSVLIRVGTAAIVTANGNWDVCGGACPSDADGATNGSLGFCPGVAGDPAGELIGSVDGGNTFFAVGSGPTEVSSPGELLLGSNDCLIYDDNSGSITATIVLIPTDKDACKNDGWRTLQQADGTSFDNQGNCIQYVLTGN